MKTDYVMFAHLDIHYMGYCIGPLIKKFFSDNLNGKLANCKFISCMLCIWELALPNVQFSPLWVTTCFVGDRRITQRDQYAKHDNILQVNISCIISSVTSETTSIHLFQINKPYFIHKCRCFLINSSSIDISNINNCIV